MRLPLTVVVVLGLTCASPWIVAAEKPAVQELPPGAFYRYRDGSGQLVMTSTLPKEAIELGYEIIDGHGRVVAVVEKALPEEERQRLLEEKKRQAQDEKLLRMYPTPDDAVRARDRQVQAVRLSIDYANNTLAQLRSKLDQEIAVAARHERAGREIPENLQVAIDQYRRQIREQEELIAKHRADVQALEKEYDPIIERLRQLQE